MAFLATAGHEHDAGAEAGQNTLLTPRNVAMRNRRLLLCRGHASKGRQERNDREMSGFFWFYFGTDGRLTRTQWWLGGLLLFGLGLLVAGIGLAALGVTLNDFVAALESGEAGNIRRDIDVVSAGDAALFFLPWVCLSVKRRHDRGRSGADYVVVASLALALEAVRLAPYMPGLELPASFDAGLQLVSLGMALSGLYLLFVLGFRGTVQGANRYGPDPLAIRAAAVAGPLLDALPPRSTHDYDGHALLLAKPAPAAGNPVRRYWRGLYPLGPSYWLANGFGGILVEAGLIGFLHVFDPDGTVDPLPGFLGIGAAGLAMAGATIWLRVGAFRAGQRRARERHAAGRRAFWPRLAQVMVLPPLLLDAGMLYFVGLLLWNFFPMAFGNDPAIPNYVVRVLPGARSVEIEGGIKYGLAGALGAALDGHPGIRTLVLESPGGRLGASEQIAGLVSARGLDTYVATHCESACTRIFVAGRSRVLREGGRLGFHSGRVDLSLPTAAVTAMNETFAASYVAAGVDPGFMARVEAVAPSNIWYPTDAELLAAHVVTRISAGQTAAHGPDKERRGR